MNDGEIEIDENDSPYANLRSIEALETEEEAARQRRKRMRQSKLKFPKKSNHNPSQIDEEVVVLETQSEHTACDTD